MTSEGYPLAFSLNGARTELAVAGDERLASVLRTRLGLTGTKLGCEVGVCGACTVLVDGRPTSSCITLALQVDGATVVTAEGLHDLPGMREVQDAFASEGGYQCGFCTSGQLVNAAALLVNGGISGLDDADLKHRLDGNICRCTGYYGIIRALRKAMP